MTAKRPPLLPSLLIFVSLPALAFAAPQPPLVAMTDWHVAPMMAHGDASPSYCAIATHYESGPLVTFTRNPAGKGSIAVDFPNAAMDKGQKYAVTMKINGKGRTFQATAISKTQLVVQTGVNKTLEEALSSGQPITLSLDGTPGIYTLAGNVRAFYEFDHCLKGIEAEKALAATQPTPAPPPLLAPAPASEKAAVLPPASPQPVPPETVTESKTVIFDKTSPAPVAPEAPMDLAKPAAAGTTAEKTVPSDILWDKTEVPPAIKQEAVKKEPVAPPTKPAVYKKDDTLAKELAKTVPAVGNETPQPATSTVTELKSSLAKARADAGETAPQKIAPPKEKSLAEKITPERVPLAHASDDEMHGLLFDNGATKPASTGLTELPPTLPPKKAITPAPVVHKTVTPLVLEQKETPRETTIAPPLPAPPIASEPVQREIIPALPPAMPPALKPTLSVSADPGIKTAPATVYNTVTPSVGHPAQEESLQRYIPRFNAPSAAPRRTALFKPSPAAATGQWTTRTVVGGKGNSFCLMENSFSNDATLMIGQRADGFSTLGVNYGIDMLQPSKAYAASVKVDGEFDESFNAYAESPKTLIVQLGKKASFFSALPDAQALHIALPGVASTFAMQGAASGLDAFSDCVVGLGGSPVMTASAPSVPAVPVEKIETAPLPTPSAASPAPVPAPAVEEKPAAAPAKPVSSWSRTTRQFMSAAGINNPRINAETAATWTDGALRGTAENAGNADILDAATAAIDKAERSCAGTFDAQIGLPENVGGQTVQSMESKCTATDGTVTVSTWLARQNADGTTVWKIDAPRDQRGKAFSFREKLLSLVQKTSS